MNTLRTFSIAEKSSEGLLKVRLEDLLDIAAALGDSALWTISSLELSDGEGAGLYRAEAEGMPITFAKLRELASSTNQVINGEFAATKVGEDEPVVVIRSIDSTSWDMCVNDVRTIAEVLSRFPGAAEVDLE